MAELSANDALPRDEQLAHDVIMLRSKSKIIARMHELQKQLPALEYGRVRLMVTMQLSMLKNYVYYAWAPRIQPEDIIDDTGDTGTDTAVRDADLSGR